MMTLKNRSTAILVFALITVIVAAGVYIYFLKQSDEADAKISADDLLKRTLEIPEMTTNLKNEHYIRVSFKIQTDDEKTKEELEKRDYQVKNVIIKLLSGTDAKDLQGTQGKIKLENQLKEKLNELAKPGSVEQVYITSILIQ
ncbi:MAG: flagellar basal body-associated protein FliL [Caldibacillus debilis]|jgi:flagellar protein FliL|uniref:Flagellar protein FliL n=1 Tax=Caldibacillus debilis TaxID=301148 RepID=A0A3E0K685_9BACI|nr:flagellar basal body-associated protein FliL [Bacillaceae bacterium]MBY6271047.1 flagellar basal body-associated protein FliL [Bacillaceae bacterium]REJ15284.1 MAG: flagellar basal body-associated protein FliL [Caldibacillus debilis]REJ29194.1 MAG: flagellar basal body-associated protein FliL [Caldibacillus debilis]REJ29516.1 MAG: flagellar basal body-associated protein FliL [Caldibacillus debilis]